MATVSLTVGAVIKDAENWGKCRESVASSSARINDGKPRRCLSGSGVYEALKLDEWSPADILINSGARGKKGRCRTGQGETRWKPPQGLWVAVLGGGEVTRGPSKVLSTRRLNSSWTEHLQTSDALLRDGPPGHCADARTYSLSRGRYDVSKFLRLSKETEKLPREFPASLISSELGAIRFSIYDSHSTSPGHDI